MAEEAGGIWLSRSDREGLTAMTVDHIRLSYGYLDARNLDALGSLYAADVVRLLPGLDPIVGRDTLIDFYREQFARYGSRHTVDEVIAAGRRMSVRGRVTVLWCDAEPIDIVFVDLFGVGGDGLLTAQQTFYFVAPTDKAITP